jgi:hypothetical protein
MSREVQRQAVMRHTADDAEWMRRLAELFRDAAAIALHGVASATGNHGSLLEYGKRALATQDK